MQHKRKFKISLAAVFLAVSLAFTYIPAGVRPVYASTESGTDSSSSDSSSSDSSSESSSTSDAAVEGSDGTANMNQNGSNSNAQNGADEAAKSRISLYDASTALTAYVNDVLGPNSNDLHTAPGNTLIAKPEALVPGSQSHKVEPVESVGNAGDLIGYGDPDNGFYSYIVSTLSYGASTSSYNAWIGIMYGDSKNFAYDYARYGRLLNDMGLDNTGSEQGGATGRGIFGWFMAASYGIAQMIPMLFSWAYKFLGWLNPFQFLKNTHSYTGYWKEAFDLTTDSGNPVQRFGGHLIDLISGTYDAIYGISWAVVVPLLFALLFAGIFMMRRDASSSVMTFVKRVVFIAIGIPVCAGVYTSCLQKMEKVTATSSAGSQMMASTFFDFQDWAEAEFTDGGQTPTSVCLAPNGASGLSSDQVLFESVPVDTSENTGTAANDETKDINTSGGAASVETLQRLRLTTFNLNKDIDSRLANTGDLPGTFMTQTVSGGIWDSNDSRNEGYGGTEKSQDSDTAVSDQLLNMMQRYTTGEFYRASDWETANAGWMTRNFNNELGHNVTVETGNSNQNKIFDMLNQTNDPTKWLDRYQAANERIFRNETDTDNVKWAGKPWNIFTRGTLSVDGDDGDENVSNATLKFSGEGQGLSRLAMYNYLSTAFNKSSIVVYSPKNSASEHTKEQHYSVNLVGSGMLRFAYGANAAVLLWVLVITGIAYSLGTAVSVIRHGVKLIAAVPGAALGVLKSISQVVIYTIMMIVEIIGTGFMYSFMGDLFLVFAMMLENVTAAIGLNTSTIQIGGLTASIGAAGTYGGVIVMIFAETALTAFMGHVFWKYRRAYVLTSDFASEKLMSAVSYAEMKDACRNIYEEKESFAGSLKDTFARTGRYLAPKGEAYA